jgi:acyl-CoA thioesterase
VLDPDDFALVPRGGRLAGSIAPHWCFEDRAFGGFSAALTLAGVLTEVDRPALTSATVVFLETGDIGPVEVEVTRLREGRSATLAQATLVQAGRTIVHVTAWLADAWQSSPTTAAAPPFGGEPIVAPDSGARLDWLAETWPMLRFAERRAVNYPSSFLTFRDRPSEVALWMRGLEDPGHARPLAWAQLVDVLHLDAHLFDAPGMVTGFTDPADETASVASMLSLDLTIAWQPGAASVPVGAWRLLEARGSVAERSVTSFGSLRGEDGQLIAVATSQGLLRRHTAPAESITVRSSD